MERGCSKQKSTVPPGPETRRCLACGIAEQRLLCLELGEQAKVGSEDVNRSHNVGPEWAMVHLPVDSTNSRMTLRVFNVKTHRHTHILKHISILK